MTSTVKSDRFFLVVQHFHDEGLFCDSRSPNDVVPRKLPYYLPEKWLLEVIEDEFIRRKNMFCFFLEKRIRKWWEFCHLGGRKIELASCRSHKCHGVFDLAVLCVIWGGESLPSLFFRVWHQVRKNRGKKTCFFSTFVKPPGFDGAPRWNILGVLGELCIIFFNFLMKKLNNYSLPLFYALFFI